LAHLVCAKLTRRALARARHWRRITCVRALARGGQSGIYIAL